MTNKISSASGPTNRPRLCRSDHQPNMLEYIDTTLNDSFSSRLKIQSTTNSTANGCDQFGNTIVDQYLVYILCQKLHPNRTDTRTEHLYQSLHHLLISNGTVSKSFFEYSPPPSINRAAYQSLFHSYTNFIWNEFDVDILLELGESIVVGVLGRRQTSHSYSVRDSSRDNNASSNSDLRLAQYYAAATRQLMSTRAGQPSGRRGTVERTARLDARIHRGSSSKEKHAPT